MMMHMNTPLDTPERVRVTVPVSPEVLDAFQRLAKASGMSTGRAMGDWLADTMEGAEFMAHTLEKARAAPRLAVQEMQAMALGLGDDLGALLTRMRKEGRGLPDGGRASAAPDAGRTASGTPLPPRPVIRGGKSPKTGKGKAS